MAHAQTGRRRIVIIGGGFAGTVTAIKLLDGATGGLDVIVVEDRAELGRGVAYSTVEPVHLVNGAARIFGLYPDDPDHLVRWLIENGQALGWTPPADVHDSSPPRWLYGSYVQSQLQRALADAAGRASFEHVHARVVGLTVLPGGARVELDTGASLHADEAVLALGVFPSAISGYEAAVASDPRFVANPWSPSALDHLVDASELLLIGSSLSMVDVVASMEARGYRGRYRVMSRRGQVVVGRRSSEPWRDFLGQSALPTTARGLLSAVKAERRAIAAAGIDWQGLPLAIRPHVLPLWRGASNAERLRFARHLRSFWEVTAHRAAPPAYEALRNVQAEGRFLAQAGRVLDLAKAPDGIEASIRWRRDGATETVTFGGVVNCRGHQEHNWPKIDDPLVKQLLASGIVRPHETGFGIDATPDGAIIGADGLVGGALFAIGHPLRGIAWESSSIGEQLTLAIALADRLLAQAEPVRATA